MLENGRFERRARTHGGALVEFALVLPLLFMLTMGATDFGRIYFHAITLANASATGAFHGAQGGYYAAQIDVMEQRAIEDAGNLTGVSASASIRCECPPAGTGDFTSDPTVVDCSLAATAGTCTDGGYGLPRVYVRTDVTETFSTLAPYPGVLPAGSSLIGRDGFMRVQ